MESAAQFVDVRRASTIAQKQLNQGFYQSLGRALAEGYQIDALLPASGTGPDTESDCGP